MTPSHKSAQTANAPLDNQLPAEGQVGSLRGLMLAWFRRAFIRERSR
jgi:hypothetical protein